MDCRTALDTLEAALPETDDESLSAAAAHVAECPQCELEFSRRSPADERLGRAMRDVAVPVGLQARLLSRLADAESGILKPASAATRQSAPLNGRRAMMQRLAAAAACVLVAVLAWQLFLMPRDGGLTLTQFREQVPFADRSLADFAGDFEARLPGAWQNVDRLQFELAAKGVAIDGGKQHTAALYRFVLVDQRGERIDGVVVVTRAREIKDPPAAGGFDASNVAYVTAGGTTYASVAWTEGDLVFVCFVPSGEALDTLQQALQFAPA